jgi:hypothetical protein
METVYLSVNPVAPHEEIAIEGGLADNEARPILLIQIRVAVNETT